MCGSFGRALLHVIGHLQHAHGWRGLRTIWVSKDFCINLAIRLRPGLKGKTSSAAFRQRDGRSGSDRSASNSSSAVVIAASDPSLTITPTLYRRIISATSPTPSLATTGTPHPEPRPGGSARSQA